MSPRRDRSYIVRPQIAGAFSRRTDYVCLRNRRGSRRLVMSAHSASTSNDQRRDACSGDCHEVIIVQSGDNATDTSGNFNLYQGRGIHVSPNGMTFSCSSKLDGKRLFLLAHSPILGCTLCEAEVTDERNEDDGWEYRVLFAQQISERRGKKHRAFTRWLTSLLAKNVWPSSNKRSANCFGDIGVPAGREPSA